MKKIVLFLFCFVFWQISNAQLTIYSALNQQGVSGTCVVRTIYTSAAIPNGLNNSIKSISLNQGFMATLAENEDGTGERFTYMATQSNIVVNLAFVMQNKVSFIRVLKLPTTPIKKKGAGEVNDSKIPSLNVTWFYDWGIKDSSTANYEFVPMSWSGAGHAKDVDINLVRDKDSTTHYLAFNEPDHAGQAEMTVSTALPYYKNMQRAGYRMGSPSCTESQFRVWLDSFSTEAAKQKLQIDYVGVHWYDWGNWLSTSNANPNPVDVFNRFKSYIDQVYNLHKKPIWVTEFNANANRPPSVHEAFINLVLPWMDSDPRIERYAYFFGNDVLSHDNTGALTSAGQAYANQNSVLAYPQNVVDNRPVYPEVTLAGWNTSGRNSTTSNSISNSFAPTTLNTNLTAPTPLTAGSGVTGPFNAAGYWGGLSWSNSTSASGATSGNQFLSFSLKSNTGKTVNYHKIDSTQIRVNSNGPNKYLLQYQINSGSFTDITTLSIPTVTALTTTTLSPVDLTGISALQNVPSTTTVTFRLVPFNATTTNSFAIGNGTNNSDNDLAILGSFVEDSANLITTPGNALNFDGTNDYVSIPDANSIDLTSTYTLEAWIRPTSFSAQGGIISKSQTTGSAGYYLSLSNNSPFTGINFDGLETAAGVLEAGKWYHIAAVKNGSSRTLYVNGVATALTGTAITTAANTQALTIGVHNLQAPKYFTGSIDEVRVWNTARTQASIKEFMFNSISPTTNNLVEYYNFDAGTAAGTNTGINTLQDLTASANNGTLTNFVLTGATGNWVESYAMLIPVATVATNKSSTSFTATWIAPSITSIGAVNNYLLDVSPNANFSSFVSGYNGLSVTGTSQNVTGLSSNTTYYYRVRANKSTLASQGGYSETITVSSLSSNADLSALTVSNSGILSPVFASATTAYSVTYLNNISSITVTPTKSQAAATIQVSVNGGTYATVNSGAASGSLALTVGSNTINVLVTAEDLITTKLYIITVTREINTWTGASTSNYNTAANWTGSVVPTINDDVLIPDVSAGSNRFPQITGANHPQNLSFARNVTINAGASLSVMQNNSNSNIYGHFQIAGSITNYGTFSVTSFQTNGATIEFNGTSAQTIPANTFAGNSVYNLIINNPAGVSLNGPLTVNGRLTPTQGTFTTNNSLTLSSTSAPATPNLNRTASVASGTGIIDGNVTVQRFMVTARRAFRFLAHPFSTSLPISSLIDNIDITGSGGSPMTPTATNNPSAFGYDNTGANPSINPDPGWVPLTATSTFEPKQGYRIFIRGTRGQGLNGNTYAPSTVTLDWSGPLNQGDQVITLPYNGVNKDYTLVGNPYASPVNLSLITLGSNISPNFSVWDASAATRGAYTTLPFSTGYTLPNGGTFFARATANINNTITFTEGSKATADTNRLFNTGNLDEQLLLQIKDTADNYADQLLFLFGNNLYSSAYDSKWDAEKLLNPDANFYSFSKDKQQLAIDRRNIDTKESIALGFTNSQPAKFNMVVTKLNTKDINWFLKDNFLQTETALQEGASIAFEITDNAKSQGNERFELLAKSKIVDIAATPLEDGFKAYPTITQNNQVTVNFKASNKEMTTIRVVGINGTVLKTYQYGQQEQLQTVLNINGKGNFVIQLQHGNKQYVQKIISN